MLTNLQRQADCVLRCLLLAFRREVLWHSGSSFGPQYSLFPLPFRNRLQYLLARNLCEFSNSSIRSAQNRPTAPQTLVTETVLSRVASRRDMPVGRPPFQSRADVIRSIDVIEHGVDADAARWRGRAGATDRAIEQAHITIMRRCAAIEHGAGVREVATLAGISSLSTVTEAHRRLERVGYIRRVDQAKRGRAARYVAGLPGSPSRTVCCSRALGDCSFKELGADAFRWRDGLGKATGRVWCALDGRTPAELAVALELKLRSVRKYLSRLAVHELAVCGADGRWYRLGDLDAVATRLGVAGESDRQRAQYEDEREAYRQKLIRKSERIVLREDAEGVKAISKKSRRQNGAHPGILTSENRNCAEQISHTNQGPATCQGLRLDPPTN
jgi:hypothetical protein